MQCSCRRRRAGAKQHIQTSSRPHRCSSGPLPSANLRSDSTTESISVPSFPTGFGGNDHTTAHGQAGAGRNVLGFPSPPLLVRWSAAATAAPEESCPRSCSSASRFSYAERRSKKIFGFLLGRHAVSWNWNAGHAARRSFLLRLDGAGRAGTAARSSNPNRRPSRRGVVVGASRGEFRSGRGRSWSESTIKRSPAKKSARRRRVRAAGTVRVVLPKEHAAEQRTVYGAFWNGLGGRARRGTGLGTGLGRGAQKVERSFLVFREDPQEADGEVASEVGVVWFFGGRPQCIFALF